MIFTNSIKYYIVKITYAHEDGQGQDHTGLWWETLREGDHFKNPGVDGRIMLK